MEVKWLSEVLVGIIVSVPDILTRHSSAHEHLFDQKSPARRIFVPKAYWIATYRSITDPQAIAEYAKLAGPAIWSVGGRNIVRGTPVKTLEEGLGLRTVVIEFDSVASALAAYESPAYQSARKILGDAAVRDIRIVEGVE